ncbi:MAG TPA: hypothetical protein VM260_13820, partial [Pirellula sp.]|nr:hypothetical protein [Pirellula sp.]
VVCFFGYRETIASGELKAKLDEMRQAGEPFDDESMAKFFEKTSHKEGTAAWTEILTLSQYANSLSHKLPIVGDGVIPSDLRPSSDWPEEPRVAEFLQEVRPLVKRIYKADAFPKPVWMPIHFDGFNTLIEESQSSRSIGRIVYLDAIHALYHKDGDRALKDIYALRSVAQAFDWDFCMVTRMVSMAIRGMHSEIINRSLSMDVWNDEQLTALSNEVNQPYEVSKAWKATLAGELGMAYPELNDPRQLGNVENSGVSATLFAFPVMPSTRLTVLRAYEDLQHIADAGDTGLLEQAKSVESRFNDRNRTISQSNLFLGLMMPAVSAYADIFDSFETKRRLTYSSLSVKRFQVKNKRWPKSLSELADVGLVVIDWSTTDRQSFGYELNDDVTYVWSYGNLDKKRVPSERPKPDNSDAPGSMENLVSIR